MIDLKDDLRSFKETQRQAERMVLECDIVMTICAIGLLVVVGVVGCLIFEYFGL